MAKLTPQLILRGGALHPSGKDLQAMLEKHGFTESSTQFDRHPGTRWTHSSGITVDIPLKLSMADHGVHDEYARALAEACVAAISPPQPQELIEWATPAWASETAFKAYNVTAAGKNVRFSSKDCPEFRANIVLHGDTEAKQKTEAQHALRTIDLALIAHQEKLGELLQVGGTLDRNSNPPMFSITGYTLVLDGDYEDTYKKFDLAEEIYMDPTSAVSLLNGAATPKHPGPASEKVADSRRPAPPSSLIPSQ